MRVRAYHNVPGQDQSLFGKQGMFDPHSAGFIKMLYLGLSRERAHTADLFSDLDIPVGNKVIGHEGYACRIKNRRGGYLFECINRNLGGDVVGQRKIHPCADQLAWRYLLRAGVFRQYFLDNR